MEVMKDYERKSMFLSNCIPGQDPTCTTILLMDRWDHLIPHVLSSDCTTQIVFAAFCLRCCPQLADVICSPAECSSHRITMAAVQSSLEDAPRLDFEQPSLTAPLYYIVQGMDHVELCLALLYLEMAERMVHVLVFKELLEHMKLRMKNLPLKRVLSQYVHDFYTAKDELALKRVIARKLNLVYEKMQRAFTITTCVRILVKIELVHQSSFGLSRPYPPDEESMCLSKIKCLDSALRKVYGDKDLVNEVGFSFYL